MLIRNRHSSTCLTVRQGTLLVPLFLRSFLFLPSLSLRARVELSSPYMVDLPRLERLCSIDLAKAERRHALVHAVCRLVFCKVKASFTLALPSHLVQSAVQTPLSGGLGCRQRRREEKDSRANENDEREARGGCISGTNHREPTSHIYCFQPMWSEL